MAWHGMVWYVMIILCAAFLVRMWDPVYHNIFTQYITIFLVQQLALSMHHST